MAGLILKRASASRPSGQWSDDYFDVLTDGEVVGRIFKASKWNDRPLLSQFFCTAARRVADFLTAAFSFSGDTPNFFDQYRTS
jgi:hypothetical protein